MQYHHHGYVTHDPRVLDAAGTGIDRVAGLPDEMDVLIVGAGPTGLIQAAQLSHYPEVETRIIDARAGRLEIGRADGLWSRSSETFQAFGFYERIAAEAALLGDVNFWGPDPENPRRIARATTAVKPMDKVSEYPLMIVNQSRVADYFTEYAEQGPAKININYGYSFHDLRIEEGQEYPIAVQVSDPEGNRRTVRAKYVVGADGARSKVRDTLDIERYVADKAQAWAVIDVLAETDFPDVRMKCGIASEKDGSILLIPREGGFLFRLYVSLGMITQENRAAMHAPRMEEALEQAKRILHPYTLDVKEVTWFSVYVVRHTVAKKFDDVPDHQVGEQNPRVFIAGDACHTHSAKAGQGMNVSMQDGWNLAWKLGQVLSGRSDPSLLATYTAERQEVAQRLIDFDLEWSTMMSKRPDELESPQAIGKFYEDTVDFVGGFRTEYSASIIVGDKRYQHLAREIPIGKRFQSARVTRVADSRTYHLGHHFRADGRWRLYAFADSTDNSINDLGQWLGTSPDSPVVKFTPEGGDPDAVFDVKVIYRKAYDQIDLEQVPRVFRPQVGPYQLTDREKIYSVSPEENIFSLRQISHVGALVVVRPDMYVAHVLPLTAREEITEFFAQNMVPQR